MSTEFRDIVFQTARSLRQEESQDLVYLYNLRPSFNQSRPIEVLMQLEVLQNISESNPETLAIVLERVKRFDLAKDVRKWMKQSKKKKEKRTAIIPHEQTPTSQFLHAEVVISKMGIEHVVHRLHVLQEHIELWLSNCDVSPELKDAVQFCSLVTTKLSTIEKKLVPGRCFRRSSSSPSTSDEERLPSSSFTSTIGCTRVELQLEQQLQQQYVKEQVPHSPKTTKEVHNRMCTNTSMRVPQPLVGLLPKAVVVEDHEDTGSGSDSGFSDVKQFLKPRQPPRSVLVTPQEETIDKGIYENAPVDQQRYMTLQKEEMTTDKYATLGETYVPTTDNCYEETQQQDDDDPYEVVQYTATTDKYYGETHEQDMKPKDYKPLISVPDSHEYTQVRQKSILPLKENNITISPYVTDHLYGVNIAKTKLFYIQGNKAQSLHWEEYGLRLYSHLNSISATDKCEVAITVLVGGHFKFPKRAKLVSAIYAISVAKPLLKPLMLQIQHCVNLQTKSQANRLHFVRAPLSNSRLPYVFTLLDRGQFYPGNRYGSIMCHHFCAMGVVAEQNQQPHGESDTEESSDENESTNEDNGSTNEEGSNTTDEENEEDYPEQKDEENEDSMHNSKGTPDTASELNNTSDLVTSGTRSSFKSSSELTQELPPSSLSTGLDANSQCGPDTKNEGAMPLLFMYTGILYYQQRDEDWMVRFFVVKDLDALLRYVKEEYQHAVVDRDDPIHFNFVNENGFIELILKQELPPGWTIEPIFEPCKLWQADIDKFGSTQCSLPSSCQLLVYADHDESNIAKRLVYPIPLEGITPPRTIKIHRKLIKNLSGIVEKSQDTSVITDQSSPGTIKTDVDIIEMKKLFRKVLTKHYAALTGLPQVSLRDLAAEMFSVGLISKGVQKKPKLEVIIGEFQTGMNFITSHAELLEHLAKFLICFEKIGGSFAQAASVLQSEWTEIT